jgi:hypothetical protein
MHVCESYMHLIFLTFANNMLKALLIVCFAVHASICMQHAVRREQLLDIASSGNVTSEHLFISSVV